jgi:hypothetical protein
MLAPPRPAPVIITPRPGNSERVALKSLIRDDVAEFSSIVGPFISVDHKISPLPMVSDRRHLLRNSPPLISVAALFQSVQCFRYLFANDADLTARDIHGRTLADFAVEGGNLEILSVLEQTDISFSGTLFTAAERGSYKTFIWLYLSQAADLAARKRDHTTLLHAAAKSGNMDIFHFVSAQIQDRLTVQDLYEAAALLRDSSAGMSSDDENGIDSESSDW